MDGAKGKPRRIYTWVTLVVSVLALLLAGKAWSDTMRDPVVRRIEIDLERPQGPATPHRIVFLADIHVAGPDMPPDRLARIVAQVNALRPDTVLFAGDFISDKDTATKHYETVEALAPLAALGPRTIKLAVPGNHDHWRDVDEVEQTLEALNIGVLRNEVTNSGGLIVAGLDDDFTGHADVAKTVRKYAPFGRTAVVLSHSPDPFPQLPAQSAIMLAGHTHCGQIAWPWGGSPATMSRYGQRYACGVVRERGNLLITSAGLGTSVLPFRLFTQPEIWVIDTRP